MKCINYCKDGKPCPTPGLCQQPSEFESAALDIVIIIAAVVLVALLAHAFVGVLA